MKTIIEIVIGIFAGYCSCYYISKKTLNLEPIQVIEKWIKIKHINLLRGRLMEDNRSRHLAICEELNELYQEKNTRYGNSFSELYGLMGMDYVVPRLYEKVKRLLELTRNDLDGLDESIEDSLRDLANYSIMTLMELERRDK